MGASAGILHSLQSDRRAPTARRSTSSLTREQISVVVICPCPSAPLHEVEGCGSAGEACAALCGGNSLWQWSRV
jgi:hypothetical protein